MKAILVATSPLAAGTAGGNSAQGHLRPYAHLVYPATAGALPQHSCGLPAVIVLRVRCRAGLNPVLLKAPLDAYHNITIFVGWNA